MKKNENNVRGQTIEVTLCDRCHAGPLEDWVVRHIASTEQEVCIGCYANYVSPVQDIIDTHDRSFPIMVSVDYLLESSFA